MNTLFSLAVWWPRRPYPEGGYETPPLSSKGAPGVEGVRMGAMKQLLQ